MTCTRCTNRGNCGVPTQDSTPAYAGVIIKRCLAIMGDCTCSGQQLHMKVAPVTPQLHVQLRKNHSATHTQRAWSLKACNHVQHTRLPRPCLLPCQRWTPLSLSLSLALLHPQLGAPCTRASLS